MFDMYNSRFYTSKSIKTNCAEFLQERLSLVAEIRDLVPPLANYDNTKPEV